jgi:glycosyltransferase involved in cell wall biosynthesis
VSKKAKKIYKIKGYDKKKLKFIPNGYDLSILKIDKIQKINFHKKINLRKTIPIIGNVARYDQQKDHLNLLHALSIIQSKKINFFCILVGSNIDQKNLNLSSEIKKLKLSNSVKLLGRKNNISEVMNGIDIHVLSSSYGEGFPNVLAESMACGTPCITTNVGDSALIVGKTGWVVPPKNKIKLAKAIDIALSEIGPAYWNKRCTQARLTIKKNFSINKMLKSYNDAWIRIYKKSN